MKRVTRTKWPNSRWGWYRYYVSRFNKTGSEGSEQLACWYLLMYLAFGEERVPREELTTQAALDQHNVKPARQRASSHLEPA